MTSLVLVKLAEAISAYLKSVLAMVRLERSADERSPPVKKAPEMTALLKFVPDNSA